MTDVQLITFDPGHFHAALVQKDRYPGVARQVHVYAPLGPDLLAHLTRVAGFNSRKQAPTAWEVEVHDLNATILHLLGIDHTRLTYRFQGRDFRLTDVGGQVVTKLLA